MVELLQYDWAMIDQIKKWLEDQGYPLEMRTASELRKAGFDVTQSELYTDQETGKAREIDVVALYPDHVGVTRLAIFLECKASKKPWLLLCDPQVLAGYNRVRSFAAVDQNAIKAMHERPVFDVLMSACPWFRKDELTGYSLRSAFSEKDIAYEATLGAAKASIDYVNGAKDYQQTVAFPVIVIASPLIRCSLDKDGEIQLEEIIEGEVFVKYDLVKPFRTCVRIVTLAGLPEFARRAWQVAGILRAQLADGEAKLWERQFSSPYPTDLRRLVEKGQERTAEETNASEIEPGSEA